MSESRTGPHEIPATVEGAPPSLAVTLGDIVRSEIASDSKVRRAIREGRLKAALFSGQYWITEEDLRLWIEHELKPPPPISARGRVKPTGPPRQSVSPNILNAMVARVMSASEAGRPQLSRR